MADIDLTSAQIEKITQDAFDELMKRIRAGEDAQTVIQDIQAKWDQSYLQVLQTSFSELLAAYVGVTTIESYLVGGVTLSDKLYANSREVTAAVLKIVNEHLQGVHDGRALALAIYDGYVENVGLDALKVKADMSKYLLEVLKDPAYAEGYRLILAKEQAMTIKTPALRAAYLQLLEALEAGEGMDRLEKLLDVAWNERNRFFANRIAVTELTRAQTDKIAAEFMADPRVQVLQWRLSATHPEADICDYHANVNLFGLGPGCYPKAYCPKPPAHPFCRCTLRSRPDLEATAAKLNPDAAREWLLAQDDANRIIGSKAKLAAYEGGTSFEAIQNSGKDPLYHIHYVGG